MEGGDEEIQIVDSKDLQQQSKAFDKLTDHVEDRQLDSTRVQEVTIVYTLYEGTKLSLVSVKFPV